MTEQQYKDMVQLANLAPFARYIDSRLLTVRQARLLLAAMFDQNQKEIYSHARRHTLPQFREGNKIKHDNMEWIWVTQWCTPHLDNPGDPPMSTRVDFLVDIIEGQMLNYLFGCSITVQKYGTGGESFCNTHQSFMEKVDSRPIYSCCPKGRAYFHCKFCTPLVRNIAQQAWNERGETGLLNNGTMNVLADALEDANCNHEAVLAHLRGGKLHIRGCWVLDAILENFK